MANSYFQFKQFTVHQDRSAMKVTTDACLFGAYVATACDHKKDIRVLDIGTGTGLLALMLAQKNPKAVIDAIEKDEVAAAQARENSDASPWKQQVNVMTADAREYAYAGKYDMVISNPPFYERELKGEDSRRNMAHHDEGLLLPGLLEIIQRVLKPGGHFFLLLPYKRNEEIRKLLLENQFCIEHLVLVRPSTRHPFFRILLKGSRVNETVSEISIDEIAIREESNDYTAAFTALLKDYYLHL